MTKSIQIIHLGLGKVGKKVMDLILNSNLNLEYVAFFTSKGGYYNQKGIRSLDLNKIQSNIFAEDVIKKITKPFIVIDTTASDKTIPILKTALKKGGYVVMSNKKPLSSSQNVFDEVHLRGVHRLFYETTVGAGLPVIYTLKYLLNSGDEIKKIEGCFSGTLGFICSSLENGMNYSDAIIQAKDMGFTEPDPRDDLSGLDVARKALILGRMLGLKLELKNITRTPLYDESLAMLTIPNFLKETSKSNKKYQNMFMHAQKENMTYRYVAKVTEKGAEVGLKKVAKSSPIGSLKGPDNIIVFQTKFYGKNPLAIQGPGAGVDVTAAGVVGDILQIINRYDKA